MTLDGVAAVTDDPVRIADAARRYRQPPPAPPGRVVVEIAVDRVTSLDT